MAKSTTARLGFESLEGRDLMSVSNVWFSGDLLVVKTDNTSTSVDVRQAGSNVTVKDVSTNRTWTYAANKVGRVEFQGGAGNDRFVNGVNVPTRAFAGGGNDYVEGNNRDDYFDAGAGNDTIKGFGGNDKVYGGTGNDVALGMDGHDSLIGQDGDDRLNGGAGIDYFWGGNGNDDLVAIDAGTTDYVMGEVGYDVVWVDGSADKVWSDAYDKTNAISAFANGADRTLNGDRIADPGFNSRSGAAYKRIDGSLFGANGPKLTDVRQGNVGDCWLLAGLSAVAKDNPHAIRQRVVDFDDGTYGVALGTKVYRVDNDLPVWNGSNSLVFSSYGDGNSLWVPIVEKAYAHYRTGANNYDSLSGGLAVDLNKAFGSTTAGTKNFAGYGNATAVVNDIYAKWSTGQAVTLGIDKFVSSAANGAALIMGHAYTVVSVTRNSAGVVTAITLRNPWGYDGAGNDGNTNDGLVTITPGQLFGHAGSVQWGRV